MSDRPYAMLVSALVLANIVSAVRLWSDWQAPAVDPVLATVLASDELRSKPARRQATAPSLLLLVDPAIANLAALMDKVDASVATADLNVYAVVRDPTSDLLAQMGRRHPTSHVVAFGGLSPAERGRLPAWNKWLMFDRSGAVKARGDLRRGGYVGAISTIVHHQPGFSAQVVQELEQTDRPICASGDEYPTAGNHMTALFVRRANTSCGTAPALGLAQRAADANPTAKFVIVVPESWTTDDIGALRWTFDLRLPICRTTAAFGRRWSRLEQVFGQDDAAAFLALLTPTGVDSVYSNRTDVLQTLEALAR